VELTRRWLPGKADAATLAGESEGEGLVEVGSDLGIERRDFGGEGGYEFLRRRHDADGVEVLFADFGEGGAGGTAFYLGHVRLLD
jgi:hypothetical protein